ncbi:DotU family type IV/VI secretion system protein [Silvibacterium acidisoli]|uniref:DotU family type IV/VI secretion system protein n=1 Tax=Acidobacteriaceae bacterium ZG23-2 TaxID=2883246 RepID=UPI00406C4B4C
MTIDRSSSLASVFQEVLTAIVRVRFRSQSVADAPNFRRQIRQLLQAPMRDARDLGYDNQKIQGSVFAVVALLDESILNLQDPAFAEWARQPLQEELFGGHLAGETFFRNLRSYLSEQDSQQLADVLELHCLCLLLGYRGRYALGDSGELYSLLRQSRARIERIRGHATLGLKNANSQPSAVPQRSDSMTRSLLWSTLALAGVMMIAYCLYYLLLASGAAAIHNAVAGTL